MTTVWAVFEGGVLRPIQPLRLNEGETVEVTVTQVKPSMPQLADDEVTHRLKSAKTMEEWIAATQLLPPDDGGYDIAAALNANRVWSGERPLHPAAGEKP